MASPYSCDKIAAALPHLAASAANVIKGCTFEELVDELKHVVAAGGWRTSDALQRDIEAFAQEGDTVVEFGSGTGTKDLVDLGLQVYSVEHNEYWCDFGKKAGIDSDYQHAPIVALPEAISGFPKQVEWYDVDSVEEVCGRAIENSRAGHVDHVLIDGPPGEIGRAGVLYSIKHGHLDVSNAVIFIDDIHRADELNLGIALSQLLLKTHKIVKRRSWYMILVPNSMSVPAAPAVDTQTRAEAKLLYFAVWAVVAPLIMFLIALYTKFMGVVHADSGAKAIAVAASLLLLVAFITFVLLAVLFCHRRE